MTPITPMISRTTSSGHHRADRPGEADADHRAGQHHLQVPAVIVAPVPPDRDHVLHHQDRQQDRERLQRRHREREQRRRRHADAGEAALGEADQQHGGERGARNSGSVNTGLCAVVAGSPELDQSAPALETLNCAWRHCRAAFSNRPRWIRMPGSSTLGGSHERRRKARGEEVRQLRRVLSVLPERTFRPHLPPAALRRLDARAACASSR